jgi:hypothetical protein
MRVGTIAVFAVCLVGAFTLACSGESGDDLPPLSPHRTTSNVSDSTGSDAGSAPPGQGDDAGEASDSPPPPPPPPRSDAGPSPATDSGSGGPDSSSTTPVSFSGQVQPLFTNRCANCHKAGNNALVLTAGAAYANIVNISAANCVAAKYVVPGQPAQSYLVAAITTGANVAGCNGGFMAQHIAAAGITTITNWVQQGAQNN